MTTVAILLLPGALGYSPLETEQRVTPKATGGGEIPELEDIFTPHNVLSPLRGSMQRAIHESHRHADDPAGRAGQLNASHVEDVHEPRGPFQQRPTHHHRHGAAKVQVSTRSTSPLTSVLAAGDALPEGHPSEDGGVLSPLPSPLKYTILLSSDAGYVDKCIGTTESLRQQNYKGLITYVTETEQLPTQAWDRFKLLDVDVLNLATILELAHPGANDSQWTNASSTPAHCDFTSAFTAPIPRRTGNYEWGPPETYANKRKEGWRGYWLKVLTGFTSYWSTVLALDRVMYVDCGATALAAPIDAFFSGINSAGKLFAQDDWLTFGKFLRDGCERACNETAYDEQWGSFDKLLGAKNAPVRSFNSAMMLYDTALLGNKNSALREITQLFASPIGGIIGGDQEVLNWYFGPLGRNVWTNLPTQRADAQAGSCFYAYSSSGPYQPTNCTNYLMVKSA